MPRRSPRRKPRPRALKIPLPQARRGRRLSPGVVRVDQTHTHGYVVRVGYLRTRKGWRPRFKAYFGDATYGSRAKALAAAMVWLDTLTRTGKAPKKLVA